MATTDPTSQTNTQSLTTAPNSGSNTIASVQQTGNAAQVTPAQITSTPTWNNTADQTVQGQVQGIIASNSPLMQQAKTQALQGMNDRGLLNSSIAQTAGQSALYSAALPIAQSDAAQASKVAGTNVQNANANLTTNVNAQNAAASQNQAATNTATNLGTQIQGNKDIAAQQAEAQKAIADIEAQYKQLTQGSASAATIMTNAQTQIANILANTSITDKNAAIQQIRDNVAQSMQLIGSLSGNIDLRKYVS